MNKAILVVLGLILALLFIDQLHSGDSLQAVKQRLDAIDSNVQAMSRQQSRMRQEIERLNDRIDAGVAIGEQRSPAQAALPEERDGRPKAGVNFLLPYDRSHFEPEKIGGTYRFFGTSIDEGLNGILNSRVSTSRANGLVNDGLCEQRPEHPDLYSASLATSCVIDDDYRTFTFKLRRGVLWQVPRNATEPGFEWLQEEVELTAEDFVFGIEMILDPDTECAHLKPYFDNLESITALDDYTLQMRWKETEYINVSMSCGLSPLPKHVYSRYEDGTPIPAERLGIAFNEHWFDKEQQLIGVGRYTLVEFDHTKGYLFRRNPTYWGTPEHFDALFWDPTAKQPEPELVGFKNNEVHTHGLAPHQYKAEIVDRGDERFAPIDPDDPTAGREGVFGWERVKSSSYGCFIWNMRRPTLADKRVRQALAHCYPRKRILREVLFGLGEDLVANVHPDDPHYNDQLEQYGFDLVRARELLDAAGWTDGDGDGWRDRLIDGERQALRLEMVYYVHSSVAPKILALYADECRGVGIELRGVPVDGKEWGRRAEDRNFDGFNLSWSMSLDADFKQLWHSEGASQSSSSNYPGFANERADEIIAAMRRAFDFEERDALIKEFQAIIHQEQPYLFMHAGVGIFCWHNKHNPGGDNRQLLKGWEYGFEHYHPLRQISYRARCRMRWFLEPR